MKLCGALVLCLCCFAGASRAAPVNIATLTCARYQNEVIAPPVAVPDTDPINTMMWLFGYSVGRSGAHVMYGDALAGFGFALDAECKNNPAETLLDALAKIKPDNKNPMDLSALECQTFASRHVELLQSDRESADTIMMWLFGFAVAKTGSHLFDSSGLPNFETALMADCTKYPGRSLFDELAAVKFAAPKT
jgi:HdeA/HdeB family